MKIVEPGNLDRLKRIERFECEDCGCIFEADEGEYHYATQMEWLDGVKYTSTCPECGRKVYKRRNSSYKGPYD